MAEVINLDALRRAARDARLIATRIERRLRRQEAYISPSAIAPYNPVTGTGADLRQLDDLERAVATLRRGVLEVPHD